MAKKTVTSRAALSTDPKFSTSFVRGFAGTDIEAAGERKGRALALKIAIGDAPSPSKDPAAFVAHMLAHATKHAPKMTADDATIVAPESAI